MKVLGLTLLLAAAVLGHQAQASCTDAEKLAMNHNGADPTKPGTIGGCGTGQYKANQYQSNQDLKRNKKIMKGTNGLGTQHAF